MANEVEDLHVDDIGTRIIVTLVDSDDQPVDLSDTTLRQFLIRKPSGTIVTATATFVTDGTDGQLQYITISTTFSEAGFYKLQVYIEEDSNRWHTDKTTFRVYPNLE